MTKRCETCGKETEHYWKHDSGLSASLACEPCDEALPERPKEEPSRAPMVVFKGSGYSKASIGKGGGRRAIIDRQTGETLASRKELSFKNYD